MKAVREEFVQVLWYDARWRPPVLKDECGVEIKVLQPGVWNENAGPDFTNAVLSVDGGRRICGDVEVHVLPTDWDSHGHGRDRRYCRVIAHVTWFAGRSPRTLPPQAYSIVLGPQMIEIPSVEQIDFDSYPFGVPDPRTCKRTIGASAEKLKEYLLSAGKKRISEKARIFLRSDSDSRILFCQELMAAMGYGPNAAGFRNLARRLAFDALPAQPDAVGHALIAAATFEEMTCRGCRPSNQPTCRLKAAAHLLTDPSVLSLAETNDFSPSACRKMLGLLSPAIGRGRAAAILANVLVPFAMAQGRLAEPPDWLPPEDVSAPVRLMAHRLFGRDHHPLVAYARNGVLIQGLLYLHHIDERAGNVLNFSPLE